MQYLQVGLLQKLTIVLILASLFLVSAETVNENIDVQAPSSATDETTIRRQSLRHSFDGLFSSKRKVPNASDPLHNR